MDTVHQIESTLPLADLTISSGLQDFTDKISKLHQLCQYDQQSQFMDTKTSAQDVDQLRQALNVDKMSLYNASFGTRLGLIYLINYPEHVENMVLDSNISPNNDLSKFISEASIGNEKALNQFFEFCSAAQGQCPLFDPANNLITADQMRAAYKILLSKTQTTPGIPTSINGSYFTSAMFYSVILGALSDNSIWNGDQGLAAALHQAIISNYSNADLLMQLYISLTGYNPSTGQLPANDAIGLSFNFCSDHPPLIKKLGE